LKALELENKKSLFVLGDTNKMYICRHNLKASSVVSSLELSTYAILNNNLVLLEFFGVIEENLSK
jgi:large subunit ribosomal protein L4